VYFLGPVYILKAAYQNPTAADWSVAVVVVVAAVVAAVAVDRVE
jgi:hypothetical protein